MLLKKSIDVILFTNPPKFLYVHSPLLIDNVTDRDLNVIWGSKKEDIDEIRILKIG